MPRIALGIEYNGSRFHGWQWQQTGHSVQAELESALSKVAAQQVSVVCAGRTDAGVHAMEQVVHFDTDAHRDPYAWVMGGNTYLLDEVRILWAMPAVDDFHARYSAIARFYRYVFFNRPVKSALRFDRTTWCRQTLDEKKMHLAAQTLLGEHDFSSFRAHSCQSKSPCRMMHFIDVYRDGDCVIMDICANAFVHHMVRNIAGTLMEIGLNRQPVEWTQKLLEVKDRRQGGMTAAPNGLHLGGVCYPALYQIPLNPVFKKLPPDAARFD